MSNLAELGPLFQWAEAQGKMRRSIPPIIRRIARHAGISHLHAAAFIEANAIGPVGAR